ncbi:uncharacterized protein LOC129790905 [Lutzomyia longipalpis]|uniref:Putative conserved plasma membrane protein n=1 Tax=Lutzomyia longipalpis TaxID=7200 RepID=A0A7G3ADZ8_LUTLO|nr:uncharacterized protein LOC129790905 [Lutzomyia longipalpis]
MVDLDTNFDNMTKYQIICKYIENVNRLRSVAPPEMDFSDFLMAHLNRYTFASYVYSTNLLIKSVLDRKRKIVWWIFTLLVAYTCLSYKHEAYSLFLRRIQTHIYPGMKLWRKLTLPIITQYPTLTDFYDEACLLGNPLFQVADLDCTPCSEAANVLDFTNFNDITHSGEPFMFKSSQKTITVANIYEIFLANEAIFRRDAFRVLSSNHDIRTMVDLANDFLNTTLQAESHSIWRCNRMHPARVLRQLFPRPQRLPETGMALERFLMIDTPAANPYRLPDMECSNVFVIQAAGTRTFILRPTSECRSKCRTLSVRLPTSYVLIYDWWYWRPISVPDEFTSATSVAYVGSYC